MVSQTGENNVQTLKEQSIGLMSRLDQWVNSLPDFQCKRKRVFARAMYWYEKQLIPATEPWSNGPVGKLECTNEVGNCGCLHAEPKVLVRIPRHPSWPIVLFTKYSPCTFCANLIVMDPRRVSAVIYDVATIHDNRGLQIVQAFMPIISLTGTDEQYADLEAKLFPR